MWGGQLFRITVGFERTGITIFTFGLYFKPLYSGLKIYFENKRLIRLFSKIYTFNGD